MKLPSNIDIRQYAEFSSDSWHRTGSELDELIEAQKRLDIAHSYLDDAARKLILERERYAAAKYAAGIAMAYRGYGE